MAVGKHHDVYGAHRQVLRNLECRVGRDRRESRRSSGKQRLEQTVCRAEGRAVALGRYKNIGVVDADDLIGFG